MPLRLLLLAAFFAGALLVSGAKADASLKVCDRSPQPATVALAVVAPSATGVVTQTQGWWQIDAGTCSTLIDTPLQRGTLYYLYGKSPQYFWSGNPKKGSNDAQFCANAQNGFNYTDRPKADCTSPDDQMVWFIHEPVNGTDWTINLDMPTQF